MACPYRGDPSTKGRPAAFQSFCSCERGMCGSAQVPRSINLSVLRGKLNLPLGLEKMHGERQTLTEVCAPLSREQFRFVKEQQLLKSVIGLVKIYFFYGPQGKMPERVSYL